MNSDILPKSIYSLEFSEKRGKGLFYFYNLITKEAYWDRPPDPIVIHKADVPVVVDFYNLVKSEGTLNEQAEFSDTLREHSVRLPPDYMGKTKPEFTNATEKNIPLREWIARKTEERKQQQRQSAAAANTKVNPAALNASLNRLLGKNGALNQNTGRPSPRTVPARDRNLESNLQSQNRVGVSPESARKSFELSPRSRSSESNPQTQSQDVPQSSASLFRRPVERFPTGSLNSSRDSLNESNENAGEKNTSRRSDPSSLSSRRSRSSSSSDKDTVADWRRGTKTQASDDKEPMRIVTHKPRGINIPPGSGPPYGISMRGNPYSTTREDIKKIILKHGEAEVVVATEEDAVKAMKRDKDFIKNRYVNLRIMERAPKPGVSFIKDEGGSNQDRWSGERGRKRPHSFTETNTQKWPKTFEERPRITPVTLNTPCNSMTNPTERLPTIVKHQPIQVNNISKGPGIKSRLGKVPAPATVTSGALEQMDWDQPQNELQEGDRKVITPAQKNPSKYENVYLVCDTCALLNDPAFLDKLIAKGSWLGVPVTIIIPFVVLDELDKQKLGMDKKAIEARGLTRTIKEVTDQHQADPTGRTKRVHLKLQEGILSWKAWNDIKLNTNDDSVLNCALQIKDRCKENEDTILVTADINLALKAGTYNVTAKDWHELRRWIRMLKYSSNDSKDKNADHHEDLRMEVDPYSDDEDEMEEANMSCSPARQRLNGFHESPLDSQNYTTAAKLQNLIKTTVKDMFQDFQELLRLVIKAAVEKEYKDLRHHATSERPNWKLIDYIRETKHRWSIIKGCNFNNRLKATFSEIEKLYKKSNEERSVWVPEEVERLATLFTTVAREFTKDFQQLVDEFTKKLNGQKEEWREGKTSLESETNPIEAISPRDISSSDVDTALQNIIASSRLNVQTYLTLLEGGIPMKTDSEVRKLQQLWQGLDSVHTRVRMLEMMKNAKLENQEVLGIIEALKTFKNESGEEYGFDLGPQDVIELYCNPGFRTYIQTIEKTIFDLRQQAHIIIRRATRTMEKYRQADAYHLNFRQANCLIRPYQSYPNFFSRSLGH